MQLHDLLCLLPDTARPGDGEDVVHLRLRQLHHGGVEPVMKDCVNYPSETFLFKRLNTCRGRMILKY